MYRKSYRFEIVTRLTVKAPDRDAARRAARYVAEGISPEIVDEVWDCDAKLKAGRSTVRPAPTRRTA
jgi:hypothetical protein